MTLLSSQRSILPSRRRYSAGASRNSLVQVSMSTMRWPWRSEWRSISMTLPPSWPAAVRRDPRSGSCSEMRRTTGSARREPSAGLVDLPCGGDETDVTERLGEVPEQLSVCDVDLFGEQAEVVRVARELIEEPLGALELTGLGEARDEPERTDHERSLLAGESVGVQPLV